MPSRWAVPAPGGRRLIAGAADPAKDQSYMLAMLGRPILERLRFPLGELRKDAVRAMARAAGLPAADAVESQEVCFVGEGGYVGFLERHAGLLPRPGPILDRAGNRVGTHDGHWRYTVGQRRGIGLAGPEPLYVLATDAATNAVTVGPREALAAGGLTLRDVRVHGELGDAPLELSLIHI